MVAPSCSRMSRRQSVTARRSPASRWRLWLATFLFSVAVDFDVCVAQLSPTDNDKTFRFARCRVRCLASQQAHNEIVAASGDDMAHRRSSPLDACRHDAVCSSCLVPCDHPFPGVEPCMDQCQQAETAELAACSESCHFLNQIDIIRPGTCPPETLVTGHAAVCANVCTRDADCDDVELKCCANSCGWTCQRPSHMYDSMPDIPGRPTVRDKGSGRGVEVTWNAVLPNNTGFVLYLVQRRAYSSRHAHRQHAVNSDDSSTSPWQQIEQMTSTMATFTDLRTDHWYQVRTAAVNVYGSQGWSQPSAPFTTALKPKKPGRPTNVTLGDIMIRDHKIAMAVTWSPPTVSEFPIIRYKLYWSRKRHSVGQSSAIREYRQVLAGDIHSFTVSDLDPDAIYSFQIQAISQYGDGTKLKGERANINIDTRGIFSVELNSSSCKFDNTAHRCLRRLIPVVGGM